MSFFAMVLENPLNQYIRIGQALSPVYFADVNISKRAYSSKKEVRMEVWPAPARVDFASVQAAEATLGSFNPIKVGHVFGPAW